MCHLCNKNLPLSRSTLGSMLADSVSLQRNYRDHLHTLCQAVKGDMQPHNRAGGDFQHLKVLVTGRHEDGGGEQPSTPDAGQLVGRLQALIMENEVAAELAVQAVAKLSWEQLQTVQVCRIAQSSCWPRGGLLTSISSAHPFVLGESGLATWIAIESPYPKPGTIAANTEMIGRRCIFYLYLHACAEWSSLTTLCLLLIEA